MALQDVASLVVCHGHITVRALELVAAAAAMEIIAVAPSVQEKNDLSALCQGPEHLLLKQAAEDPILLCHVGNLYLGHASAANAVAQVYADHL